mmetsp:Transcript_6670/g.11679  ORF Transcript_6670/g.11679 Transcript_6670/m.11679 type:complete len:216 (-) Transcript_6670:330-977(-)
MLFASPPVDSCTGVPISGLSYLSVTLCSDSAAGLAVPTFLSSRSFCKITFSILLEKTYIAGSRTRAIWVSCFTCWIVWSLRLPSSGLPGAHFAAVSMWYLSCVKCRMMLTREFVLALASLTVMFSRSFCSLRSNTATCPFTLFGVSPVPSLSAIGQSFGSPVQCGASEVLMRLKQLLHKTSSSSTSGVCPPLGCAEREAGLCTCPLACSCASPPP